MEKFQGRVEGEAPDDPVAFVFESQDFVIFSIHLFTVFHGIFSPYAGPRGRWRSVPIGEQHGKGLFPDLQE